MIYILFCIPFISSRGYTIFFMFNSTCNYCNPHSTVKRNISSLICHSDATKSVLTKLDFLHSKIIAWRKVFTCGMKIAVSFARDGWLYNHSWFSETPFVINFNTEMCAICLFFSTSIEFLKIKIPSSN